MFDRIRDALGIGDDDRDRETQHGTDAIDMERPVDDADASPHRTEALGNIDGASEIGAARGGLAGGMGATGAMGGAGALGPDGATTDAEALGPTADPGQVKTEYEMGHEFDPEHERVAESGVSRPPSERVQP